MGKYEFRFGNELRRLLYFVIANSCYAFAIQLFLAGNNIAAGGFSGIAIVLSSVLPVSIGTFIFLLNIPFLLISLFIKGKRYTLLTLCGSTIYATILNAISFLPTVTDNRLVAAVFGGLIYGVGAVFFLKSGASNGGTDLVARLLQTHFRSMSVGKMFLVVDGSVVVFAMIMFRDFEAGLYAIITIYVCSMVNDRILNGFDKANMCYIISDHNILMTVLRPRETYRLKEVVKALDDRAFVVVVEVNEVLGRGFKGFSDETPVDAPELPLPHLHTAKKEKAEAGTQEEN